MLFYDVMFTLKNTFLIGLFALACALSPQAVSAYSPRIAAPTGLRYKDFAIVQDQGRWHAFAMAVCTLGEQCAQSNATIYHEVSEDLVHWTNLGVALAPRPNTADSLDVWAPTVVKNGDIWTMFYTAVSKTPTNHEQQQIAVATSTDLLTWTRSQNNVVVNCGQFSWAYWQPDNLNGLGGDCRDPYVQWDDVGQRWIMTVAGRTVAGAHQMILGQAWSTDLVTWNELPVIASTQQYVAESGHIIEHAGKFYLFWTNNCSSGSCLRWVVGNSITGPFSSGQTLTGIGAFNFASEAIATTEVTAFFSIFDGLSINQLNWNGETPFVSQIPFADVSLSAWLDVDGNAIHDSTEPNANTVSLAWYRDNGDLIWDPSQDTFLTNIAGTQGTATNFVLPGTYWITPTTDSLQSGAPFGWVTPTTYATPVTTTWNQSTQVTWPLRVAGKRWLLNSSAVQGQQLYGGTVFEPTLAEPFDTVHSMTVLASPTVTSTIILSSDGGATWLRAVDGQWVASNGSPEQSSSISDAATIISVLPHGSGLLSWRIFPENSAAIAGLEFALDTPATVPTLISPAHGVFVGSVRPTFTVQSSAVTGQIGYFIQTSTSPTFADSILSSYFSGLNQENWSGLSADGSAPSDQNASWTPATPLANDTIYWRARSIDLGGSASWSAWSSTRQAILPSALTIYQPLVTILSNSSVRLQWTTNAPTSTVVYYTDEEDHEVVTPTFTTTHDVTIDQLYAGGQYQFYLQNQDAYGQMSTPNTIVALPLNNTVFSNLLFNTGINSITLTWVTSELATGTVEYGTTSALGSTLSEVGQKLNHSLTLNNLAANTTYYIRISGIGGTVYSGTVQSTQTLQPVIVTDPVIGDDPIAILRTPRKTRR